MHADSLFFFFYYREDTKENLMEAIMQMNTLTTMLQQAMQDTVRLTNIMNGVADALANEDALLWKRKFLLLFII